MNRMIVVFVMSLAMGACGSKQGAQIAGAIEDNKKAGDLGDWKSSMNNPEKLFAEWREEYKEDPAIAETICTELLKLEGQELSLFEIEIDRSENGFLVSGCKSDLNKKIDDYFQSQNVGATGSFQFPLNIQRRDTSQGYYTSSGGVGAKEVVLTFDDGPSSAHTSKILQTLREVNAKAVFFHQGVAAKANPQLVKMVAADGHSIGSHSMNHACLGTSAACKSSNNGKTLSFESAAKQIRDGHQAVYDILGWVDPFFRFPYGESSSALKNYLKEKATGEFFWNIDSEDWRAQSNENLIKKTMSLVKSKGKGIILFHDIQRRTAESLPLFLRQLYDNGYSVVLLQPMDLNVRHDSKLVTKK